MLKINEQSNIGKAKYVVNYCTGKKHADGSDFYDIAIFKNKKKKDEFVQELARANADTKHVRCAAFIPGGLQCIQPMYHAGDCRFEPYLPFSVYLPTEVR